MPNDNDNVFHKLDADRAIRDFADLITGDDPNKSDVFFAAASKEFEWSGGRLFLKMAGGEKIAATDPRVAEHFKTKFPFLMPPAKTAAQEFGGDTVTVDPQVIESALSGNITAKSQIARSFGADSTNSATSRAAVAKAELFLKAEAAKKFGTGTDNDAVVNGGRISTNPFHRLRRADGTIDKTIEAQISGMIKAMGHKAVTDIARAAKSPAAPLGLSLTGLPLRP